MLLYLKYPQVRVNEASRREQQVRRQEIEMNSRTTRMIAVIGLAVLATAWLPTVAMAGGVRLYEITENMKISKGGKFERRKATSELIGTADVGTPLCPANLVAVYAPGAKSCTINATGSDNISLGTGLGPFSGSYTVVVQGDNSTDSPEFVIAKGIFKGKMDFSPAVLMGIPLGHVTGKITDLDTWKTTPFTGTFRLPFVISGLKVDGSGTCIIDGHGGPPPSPGEATCLPVNDETFWAINGMAAPPLPLTPMDRYDLTTTTRPFFLLNDMKNIVPVQASEFGAGWAAVKFEIDF